MKIRSLTLLEIVIVIVIIGVLATVGFPAYKNFLEDAKARECQENLRALKTALDIYAMENDFMPASLSDLPKEYIERAYAIMPQRKNLAIRVAEFILRIKEIGLAYAQSFLSQLVKGNIALLTCPKDPDPPSKGGNSYGINSAIRSISSQEYRNLRSDTLIIADCDNATFDNINELSARHQSFQMFGSQGKYYIGIEKGGKITSSRSH